MPLILSQTLLENSILLMLTACVTGLLVPFILKKVSDRKLEEQKQADERKLREQKQFEADLARQGKIIESQVQLLENLAQLLWEYQLLAIEVSFYDSNEQRQTYDVAVQKYQEKAGGLFSRIRAEISKALRLTTLETYQKLKELYYEHLLSLDARLESLIRKQRAGEPRLAGWYEFNQFAVYTLSEMVDNALNDLAKELCLKGSETKRDRNSKRKTDDGAKSLSEVKASASAQDAG